MMDPDAWVGHCTECGNPTQFNSLSPEVQAHITTLEEAGTIVRILDRLLIEGATIPLSGSGWSTRLHDCAKILHAEEEALARVRETKEALP